LFALAVDLQHFLGGLADALALLGRNDHVVDADGEAGPVAYS